MTTDEYCFNTASLEITMNVHESVL